MPNPDYTGILAIGDPHLEGRIPGFRRDEYPEVILQKLGWCLNYARENDLLPAILGDLFHLPRDNPNWMLVRLMNILNGEVISVYGNHDTAQPTLTSDDSLSLLVAAGRLRLVSEQEPWQGAMCGRNVTIGGSSYRQRIPDHRDTVPGGLTIWLVHHDIGVPGYEEQGRIKPRERPGVDLVINGHIHRHLEAVQAGATRWLTPGNISRRARSEASRDHVPAALRVDVTADGLTCERVTVPHDPYDVVFHEALTEQDADTSESAFIAGLYELQSRRTDTGAGLIAFLDENLAHFDEPVAEEIRKLAEEVTNNADTER